MIMLCLCPAWHWQVWCGSHKCDYAEHSNIDAAHAWESAEQNFELSVCDSWLWSRADVQKSVTKEWGKWLALLVWEVRWSDRQPLHTVHFCLGAQQPTHTNTHAHTYAHKHTHTHARASTHTHIHTHTHTHTHARTHKYKHVRTHWYTHAYTIACTPPVHFCLGGNTR